MQQIYFAVRQYHDDTKRYPDSIVDLLPDGAKYVNPISVSDPPETIGALKPDNKPETVGTGYLKGGTNILICPNDEVLDVSNSSYGALVKAPTATYPLTASDDAGKFVFNYWGYNTDGFILDGPAAVNTEAGTGTTYPLLRNSGAGYNTTAPLSNPFKYSLSNRFAPDSTIITHCVYHRINTANDLALPSDLYTDVNASKGARDIVLRLDGHAEAVDVSGWKSLQKWQTQTP